MHNIKEYIFVNRKQGPEIRLSIKLGEIFFNDNNFPRMFCLIEYDVQTDRQHVTVPPSIEGRMYNIISRIPDKALGVEEWNQTLNIISEAFDNIWEEEKGNG
jgi:hypothetical protein